MMKIDLYREIHSRLEYWDAFLRQESGLPGPFANLELAREVAELGDRPLFQRYLTFTPEPAPTNSPGEFLAFCGILGSGRLLAEGDLLLLEILKPFSMAPRWRIREAVAMALQRLGTVDMARLLAEMQSWSTGNPYEQRAAIAALCETSLLADPEHARATLDVLNSVIVGLAYCWSVAVAALPDERKTSIIKWLANPDKHIRGMMQENLKKQRLIRMDRDWVDKWQQIISG
jgi:hypothetical protein